MSSIVGGVGRDLVDKDSMKLSVRLINSMGRSSRSTEVRGCSAGSSSCWEFSKASVVALSGSSTI